MCYAVVRTTIRIKKKDKNSRLNAYSRNFKYVLCVAKVSSINETDSITMYSAGTTRQASSNKSIKMSYAKPDIYPGLSANEIQIPYDKRHKVSSLVKSHLNTRNSVKYEVV